MRPSGLAAELREPRAWRAGFEGAGEGEEKVAEAMNWGPLTSSRGMGKEWNPSLISFWLDL